MAVNNDRVTIRMSCSMLHHARADKLREVIPHYNSQPVDDGLARDGRVTGDFPSAPYLQITG